MPYVSQTHFPGDRVRIIDVQSGREPAEVRHFWKKSQWYNTRFALCFNTHYPELNGAYYFNRGLLTLAQNILQKNSIHFVFDDIYRPEGLVAFEPPGSLDLFSKYILVTDEKLVGTSFMWQYSAGGDKVYGDDVVLELLLEPPCDACIKRALEIELESFIHK